jgi:hypothetical protein
VRSTRVPLLCTVICTIYSLAVLPRWNLGQIFVSLLLMTGSHCYKTTCAFLWRGGNGRIGHVQITQEKKLAMFLHDSDCNFPPLTAVDLMQVLGSLFLRVGLLQILYKHAHIQLLIDL